MITIHFVSGRTLSTQGGMQLGFLRRLLLLLRLPMPFRSWTSGDLYLVRPATVSVFQFVPEDIARQRKQAADERQAELEERQSRIVQTPGMRIPKRH